MSATCSLPKPFEDLSAFVNSWALATERERNTKRRLSSMEEIRTFYNALRPRMEDIIAYLNQFSPDHMPPEVTPLFCLALSFMEVAPAVEIFDQPDESGTFEAARFRIIEP